MKNQFKRKYLSEQYYEEKGKDFCELSLGAMTMKEICSKFLSLLRYVPYIIDEKPNIQRFLSCLPFIFKEHIEYDNPKTLEEVMRKDNFCYDQKKNKRESIPAWKNQRENNFDSKRKKEKSSIKTWEIIIEGIRVIITKVLNLKILQYPLLFLIKTQHRNNS